MAEFVPDTDQLKVEREGRVAVFTMNRPEARNALSPDLSRALREAVRAFSEKRKPEFKGE